MITMIEIETKTRLAYSLAGKPKLASQANMVVIQFDVSWKNALDELIKTILSTIFLFSCKEYFQRTRKAGDGQMNSLCWYRRPEFSFTSKMDLGNIALL